LLPTGNTIRIRWFSQWAAGDWYIYLDNVSLLQAATTPPLCTTLTSPVPNSTNAQANGTLTWAAAAGAPTGYQVTVTQVTNGPIEIYNQTLGPVTSVNVGALLGQTEYAVLIVPFNANGEAEGCTPVTFTTLNPAICQAPLVVSSLPFTTTDNTGNYGNDYNSTNLPVGPVLNPSPISTGTLNGSYLNGDDVVYAYTPETNQLIDIQIPTGHGTWLGLWVFTGCPFSQTVAFHLASTGTGRAINNLPVFGGTTYYIVISTWPAPQTAAYTLNISEVPVDCPNIPGNIGAACNDGDPGTFNDIITSDCQCVGTPYDCQNLNAQIGSPCNDGNPQTVSDVVTSDCECVGTFVEFTGCTTGSAFLTATPVCDGPTVSLSGSWTNEYSTVNVVEGDTYIFSLSNPNYFVTITTPGLEILSFGLATTTWVATFTGQVRFYSHAGPDCPLTSGSLTSHVRLVQALCPPPFDCPDLGGNFGDSCDDGNASTDNDIIQEGCICEGFSPFDCPSLQANSGDPCDDGNAATVDDVITSDCGCEGVIPFDCPDLFANIGDGCDDGDENTESDTVQADCSCAGTPIETGCAADPGCQADVTSAAYAQVIADDPFCCDVAWDSLCQFEYTFLGGLPSQDPACFDCPDLLANIGDACDDGDPGTENDAIQADCSCAGTPIQTGCVVDPGCLADVNSAAYAQTIAQDPFCCNISWDSICASLYASLGGLPSPAPECQPDCPLLGLNIGDPCDDGDPNTVGSTVDDDCNCTGGQVVVFSGCTTGSLFGNFANLVCNGPALGVANSWTNEYSTVSVISGGTYTFTLTVPTYYITITNANATQILAIGQGQVVWTSDFDGVVRYYSHAGIDCPLTSGPSTAHVRIAQLACPVDCEELLLNIGDPCTLTGFFNTFVNEDCECVGTPFDCEIEEGVFANFGDPCTIPAAGDTFSEIVATQAVGFPNTFAANPEYTITVPASFTGNYILSLSAAGNVFGGSWRNEFRVQVIDPNGNNVTLGAPGGALDEWQPSPLTGGGTFSGSLNLGTVSNPAGNWTVRVRLSFNEGPQVNANVNVGITLVPQPTDGLVSLNCACEVLDCPSQLANIGDACDDGNPNTINDVITADCGCEGVIPFDCPDLLANIGDACDDGNPNTENDVITEDCGCAGTPFCNSVGGTLTLNGSNNICAGDGEPDFLDVTLTGAAGDNSVWAVTPQNNTQVILFSFTGPNINLDGLSPGHYRLWHVSYRNDVNLVGVTSGSQLQGCFDASNPVQFTVSIAVPGTITTNSATTVCVGDGTADRINAQVFGAVGDNQAWILTDGDGNYLAARTNNSKFNLDTYPPGTYRIYHIVYSNGFFPNGVTNVDDLGQCARVSNAIEIEALDCSENVLLTSYPNPTSGVSFVTFEVSRDQQVQLEVFDLSGRHIRTLFHQNASGSHPYLLQFDGSGLPNGIYLYRLTTESDVIIDKFMIAR
jgi:hypothetical protein